MRNTVGEGQGIIPTLLFVIHPTKTGPTKPGIEASMFVIPTNVPYGWEDSCRSWQGMRIAQSHTDLRSYSQCPNEK